MPVPRDEPAPLSPITVHAATGSESATARVLAAAFVDDPVWTAIGPRRRRHRAVSNRLYFAGTLQATRRHGARIRVAREAFSGAVLGATIAYEPGAWPMPDSTAVWHLAWAAIAGPLPTRRGIRDEGAMRAEHTCDPHMYLWFIGVDPCRQGTGVGRALMAELHEHADELDVPTYLETGTLANVAFYSTLGYRVLGEIAMPSGAHVWRMERPAPAG